MLCRASRVKRRFGAKGGGKGGYAWLGEPGEKGEVKILARGKKEWGILRNPKKKMIRLTKFLEIAFPLFPFSCGGLKNMMVSEPLLNKGVGKKGLVEQR